MLKSLALAGALLCVLTINAEARQRHKTYAADPGCNVIFPCEGVTPSARGEYIAKRMGFGAAQKVYTPRVSSNLQGKLAGSKRSNGWAEEINLPANNVKHLRAKTASKEITPSYGAPSPSFAYSTARPLRYIAGRLICAINVNAALAERGVRGTGSALAHSFDGWGVRAPGPVPGAVAVTDRRGGGHVAIVSRVEGSRVFVWNPSPRGRGWQEVEYTNRHARYRVAG